MKKILSMLMLLSLLFTVLPNLPAAATEEISTDEWWNNLVPDINANELEPITGRDDSTGSGFLDEDIRRITTQPYGGRVEYAHIEGWTVSRGYFEDRYCLIGQRDGSSERIALTANDPMSFVPAGDRIIYYGEYAEGKYDWVIRNPDDEWPTVLELGVSDEVFYADEQYIWYYTLKGEETSIRRLQLSNNKKKGMGSTTGKVLTMMQDGSVLIYNYDEETIQLLKDGSFTSIYKGAFQAISSTGRSIWVESDGQYGLLADGELTGLMPGMIMGGGGSCDQQVLLIAPYENANTYDVMLFNENYNAYAHVGTVLASEDANIEIAADTITVWGPVESLTFNIPESDHWQPYGQFHEPKAIDDAPDASAPTDVGAQQTYPEEGDVFFSAGGFRVYIPMEQDAADQTTTLGNVDLQVSAWSAQNDPEVTMLVFDIDPLLDDGMRREIEQTGTLRHAQLLAKNEPVLEDLGLLSDDGTGVMDTAYVQGIPALVYSQPTGEDSANRVLVFCQDRSLILFAWSAKATTSMRDAIAFDLDDAEMIMVDMGGMSHSIFKQELELVSCAIDDISPLRELARLRVLSLRDNLISDLSPLSDLYYLEQLDLSENRIRSLLPLYDLEHLKEVRLAGNPDITQADIEELKNALPGTEVIWQENGQPSPTDEPGSAGHDVTMHDLTVTFPGQANEKQLLQEAAGLSPGDTIHEYELVQPDGGTYYFVEFRIKSWGHSIATHADVEDAFDQLFANLAILPSTRVNGGKVNEFPMSGDRTYYWTEYAADGQRCRLVYDGETLYWLIAPDHAQGMAFLSSMVAAAEDTGAVKLHDSLLDLFSAEPANEPSAEGHEGYKVTMQNLTVTFPDKAEDQGVVKDAEGFGPNDHVQRQELLLPDGRTFTFVAIYMEEMQKILYSPTDAEDAFVELLAGFDVPSSARVDNGKVHVLRMSSGYPYYWTEYVKDGQRGRLVYDGVYLNWLVATDDAQGVAFLDSMELW